MQTILVTGGTGYIGSWAVKFLLSKGYTVRLTVRNPADKQKFGYLQDISGQSAGNLEIWKADLLQDGSFDHAAEGCDAIMHIASPFTLRYRDAQKELVDPAVLGTRNVLMAASRSSSVKKVVLTSSVAAVHGDNADMTALRISAFDENYFNTSSSVEHQPYSFSKVEAEKTAWQIAGNQSQWTLTVINPAFVIGPPLNADSNSESLQFVRDLLGGKYFWGAPDLLLGFVDVRDVAQAHILALESIEAGGRHIICQQVNSVMGIASIIKAHYGKRFKLPIMTAPKILVWLVAPFFGLTRKFIARNVGYPLRFDTNKSIQQLGVRYTPIEKSLIDMVDAMASRNMPKN